LPAIFDSAVEIPRIRHGKKQTVDMSDTKEALY